MRWLRYGGPVVALILSAVMGYEGFVSPPYQDQAGVWTNGYGNTDGVTAKTAPVSEPQAREVLIKHIDKWAAAVDKSLTRPATVGQTVAYVSLTHNIGASAFAKSTVVRLHNAGDNVGACNAILRWDKITVKGKLVKNRGLAKRRAAERATCLEGIQ